MAKRKSSPKEGAKAAPSFEASLKKVEEILGRLESGEASLDESLAFYERGVAALRACREVLDRAEKRIQILVGENEDGSPLMDDFEHEGADEDDDADGEAPQRGSRRGKASLF